MPTHRYAALIAPISLTLGLLGAIALPAWSQSRGTHYINGVQGDVVVGRFLMSPDRAINGMLLPNTHRIRLRANSRVTLNCSNGGIHTLTRVGTYEVENYCQSSTSGRSGPRQPSREIFNPALPYLLSPRNTALMLSDPPMLRWNPVVGASSYEVTITGRGVNWTAKVNEPEVLFTAIEDLLPDYRYTVTITADNGLSSRTGASAGFALLPRVEAERVQRQVAEVKARRLEPDVEAIALALVYLGFEHSDRNRQSYALNQSALDVLEARILAGSDNSQLYLLQAETYLAVGLPLRARAQYERALTLARAAGQRELQAESYLGVATVAEGQTEYGDAIAHLQAAQRLSGELGDRDQVETLQARIEKLEEEL